ncbi:BTB/POZ and MATH domain-containing protein 2 isoform X2 [Lolium perenne]|uniref:BTB/POZ and MATH domain-containing protein 2 isoform X2 n=1 Tax=Lolium perenne TaxID=4522 RepID=UPI0021F5A404|nr:BTB/POZ and MATH domain-containing protein 2-like isoform X2 [Lolium perenne]
MSSFSGVSVVTEGKHCTTSVVNARTESGYHLLVVKDYSRTVQQIPNGEMISSGAFMWKRSRRPSLSLASSTRLSIKSRCTFVQQKLASSPAKDPSAGDAVGTLSDVHQHFDHLLQNKVGADVTFEVNGQKFAAHRCVLAARSKVFMAQLFGPMTESNTSSVIHIKDMEAKVFAGLLKFIYTDSFPEMDKDNNMEEGGQDEEKEEEVEYVMWLQDLFVAADRYELQRLKLLCEGHLAEGLCVSSVASTLALAEQHYCHGLKEACLKFIQDQSLPCLEKVMATDSWELIVTTYPSVLKEIIAKVASSHKHKKRKQ